MRLILAIVTSLLLPSSAKAFCLFNCPDPEEKALIEALEKKPKGWHRILCLPFGPKGGEFDFNDPKRGRLTNSWNLADLFGETAVEFGYAKKNKVSGGLRYVPTEKWHKLPVNEPWFETSKRTRTCRNVEPASARSKVEIVSSHKLNLPGKDARLIAFSFYRKHGPFYYAYLRRIYPNIENGPMKGRCRVVYDPVKKKWKVSTFRDCDYAGINKPFIDSGLARGR